MSPFDVGAVLLFLAAAFGLLNERWIRLPQPIGLLIGALGLSLAIIAPHPFFPEYDIPALARHVLNVIDLPHALLDGVLAFLLYAASLHVSLRDLRDNAWTILALATGGVILSTLVFGVLIWIAFLVSPAPVPIKWCFVLGAILAPTDAVAVDGILERVRLPAALKAAISGESLFNDGAGVVLFFIALAGAQGATGLIGHGAIAAALISEGLGGALLGLATGWVAGWAMRRSQSYNLKLTASLALVLASYRIANAIGVSGPIAVVAAGLLTGYQADPSPPGQPGRSGVTGFWSLVDELLNAMLFLLIGLELIAMDFRRMHVLPLLASIPLALIARTISVGIPLAALRGYSPAPGKATAVLTWAGLRGGVSVALALTLPDSPYRDQLLTICYAVVVFTVVVQGLTMPRVIRLLFDPHSA
jgi:monovalent cation:H+ antiporter, CPA1 family